MLESVLGRWCQSKLTCAVTRVGPPQSQGLQASLQEADGCPRRWKSSIFADLSPLASARHTHMVGRPRVGPSLTSSATSSHLLCLPHRIEGCWSPVADPRSQDKGVCVNLGQRCRRAPAESLCDWPERLHIIAAFNPLRRLGLALSCRKKTNRRISRL